MVSRAPLLALAVALVLAASPALAAPTAADRETARRLMDEGKEHTQAGEKDRAVLAYTKAHDLMKVPTTGIALAKAHLSLGHLIEAGDVALEVVRMPRENGEPAVFDKARKEAKAIDASLKPRIPTVHIVVKGGPATRVTVDGMEIAPLLLGEPVAMNPGKHTVVARNADGADVDADVDLAEGEAKQLELALVAAGALVAQDPAHRAAGSASSPDGERTTAASALVFGGFGLAAAGLVVGGLTGGLTLSKADAVKAQCENDICDPGARADLEGTSRLATISTVGFVVAGAGVALGVVGLLLPRSKVEAALRPEGRRAAVWVGPGGMGLRGTF